MEQEVRFSEPIKGLEHLPAFGIVNQILRGLGKGYTIKTGVIVEHFGTVSPVIANYVDFVKTGIMGSTRRILGGGKTILSLYSGGDVMKSEDEIEEARKVAVPRTFNGYVVGEGMKIPDSVTQRLDNKGILKYDHVTSYALRDATEFSPQTSAK